MCLFPLYNIPLLTFPTTTIATFLGKAGQKKKGSESEAILLTLVVMNYPTPSNQPITKRAFSQHFFPSLLFLTNQTSIGSAQETAIIRRHTLVAPRPIQHPEHLQDVRVPIVPLEFIPRPVEAQDQLLPLVRVRGASLGMVRARVARRHGRHWRGDGSRDVCMRR